MKHTTRSSPAPDQPAAVAAEDGAAASAAVARRADVTEPPLLSGGLECQNSPDGPSAGVSLALHWLTFTGPAEAVGAPLRLLDEAFGSYRWQQKVNGFYGGGWRWPSGALMGTHHRPTGGWMVMLPGGVCDGLSGPDLWALGQRLLFGARCTRLDIRGDVRGDGLDLIERAIASCERGELCRLRSYKPHRRCDAKTQRALDHAVELGKRVTGAGRFVRFYDKGLETGDAPAAAPGCATRPS